MRSAGRSLGVAIAALFTAAATATAATGRDAQVKVGDQRPVAVSGLALRQYYSSGIFYNDKFRDYLPLTTGQKIAFKNIVEADFTTTSTPAEENRYEYEVDVDLHLTTGQRIQGRLDRGDATGISFTGKVDAGDFTLELARKARQHVQVTFNPAVLRVCTKDGAHRYAPPEWKFCPLDGAQLKDPGPKQ